MFIASSLFTIIGHITIGNWYCVVARLCVTKEFLTHVETQDYCCMAQVTSILYN